MRGSGRSRTTAADPAIRAEDWNLIHDAALGIVNTKDDGERLARRELSALLKDFRSKYGEQPELLITEAEFFPRRGAETLLRRAYSLARRKGDAPNVMLAAWSLAEHFVYSKRDRRSARAWVRIMGREVEKTKDSDGERALRRIIAASDRLLPARG